MTIRSNQAVPSRIWNKIRLAGKLNEFLYLFEHQDPRYQVNIVQFCAQYRIKLTAPDLKELRIAYWKSNKPIAGDTDEAPVKSRIHPQLSREAWGALHGRRKLKKKPPLLIEPSLIDPNE